MAAVYWDAQHIDEGVRFLKRSARGHMRKRAPLPRRADPTGRRRLLHEHRT